MIRILGQSQFQDWENHYYVDQRLLTNSVKWILQFQRRDGSFGETENYISPLDRRLLVFIIVVFRILYSKFNNKVAVLFQFAAAV